MADTKGLVPLAGSFLTPFPGAVPLLVGMAGAADDFDVSVWLRRKPVTPGHILPDIDTEAAKDFGKRNWPGRKELADYHGADENDYKLLEAYAKACGLAVSTKSDFDMTRRLVTLTGKAPAFERAFGVRLLVAKDDDGNEFRVRQGDVKIPASLTGIILGVFGLDARPIGKPGQPSTATPPAGLPTPFDVADKLNGRTADAAKDQCIALMEFGGGYKKSEIQDYFTGIGIQMPTLVDVGVAGGKNNSGGEEEYTREVMLDICIAGAVAGSKADAPTLAVYFAPHTERGWIEAISSAVHDNTYKPSVISISWGAAELSGSGTLLWSRGGMKAMAEYLADAVYAQVTVLAATGDHGSDARVGDRRAHVAYPASDVHVIACGGTNSKTLDPTKERAWPLGGGGISDVYDLPAYQKAIKNMPISVNTGSDQQRGVPDIGGYADPGYVFTQGGNKFQAIGTSLAAPLYAALVARMNVTLKRAVGYILPDIYKYAKATRDIEVNSIISNSYNFAPGYYPLKGWDARTGLGGLDAKKLTDELQKTIGP